MDILSFPPARSAASPAELLSMTQVLRIAVQPAMSALLEGPAARTVMKSYVLLTRPILLLK